MQQRLGIQTELISAEEVARLVPSMCSDDFDIAAYEPNSGYADPTTTAAAFLERAQKWAYASFRRPRSLAFAPKPGALARW
jgi:glycine/D-amino acid oxidase-like deaminating enzyme